MKKIENVILVAAFLMFTLVLHFTSSNDFTQDLGRHLKLGEIIVQTKIIPSQNLFSYTNPDFPFTNHHWLSEVFFYLSSNLFGLSSLLILKIFLIAASVFVVVLIGLKTRHYLTTIGSALIFSPFLLDRSDIRPEIFGYLFFSIMLFFILSYPKNKKGLMIFPVIMMIWINVHITFIFGIFLLFILFLKIIFLHNRSLLNKNKYPLVILFITGLSLFINPNGLSGILYPLQIFGNYGYTIVENQNLFYLNSLIANPFIKLFFFLTPVIFISLLLLIGKLAFIEGSILAVFYVLTLFQLRHMPFFALSAIPFVGMALNSMISNVKSNNYLIGAKISLSVLMVIFSIMFMQNSYFKTYDRDKYFGLGFTGNHQRAINFLKQNKLAGNIFNNFDIGGYLIYKAYPEYKVFIDNRPEAYPADFIQNTYINLQLYPELRDQVFNQYKINTVFFSHTDQTDWGKAFLGSIYKDLNWSLVYLDPSIIIFTKNKNVQNQKDNISYMNNLVSKETNYLSLIHLANVFNLFEKTELSQKAFLRASKLNPSSCTIQKIMALQPANPLSSLNKKEKPWYCF